MKMKPMLGDKQYKYFNLRYTVVKKIGLCWPAFKNRIIHWHYRCSLPTNSLWCQSLNPENPLNASVPLQCYCSWRGTCLLRFAYVVLLRCSNSSSREHAVLAHIFIKQKKQKRAFKPGSHLFMSIKQQQSALWSLSCHLCWSQPLATLTCNMLVCDSCDLISDKSGDGF